MAKKSKEAQVRELVEEYVTLDQQIKALELKKDTLKDSIVALGEGAHRSESGQVTVTLAESRRLNNDLIKAKFGEAQLVDCYKATVSITVRVTVFPKA